MVNSARAEAEALIARLRAGLPAARRVLLACSGGVDSMLLLEALSPLGAALGVLHVDHGIMPQAGDWAAFCRQQAARRGLAFRLLRLDPADRRGNLEAWCREQRYAALRGCMAPGDLLLTAHHADDQAETVLLALMRGAGGDGLAGIAAECRFGPGRLLRPLIGLSRAEIERAARALALDWIDDPGNADRRLDRVFLRHEVMPRLRERWPGAGRAMARSALLLAEERSLREQGLESFLSLLADGPGLPLAPLREMSAAHRELLLRHWLRRRGLPPPRARVLARLESDMLNARPDREPVLRWPGGELRRYRERLYGMAPLPAVPAGARPVRDTGTPWVGAQRVVIEARPPGLRGADLRLGAPTGGERLRPAGDRHHRSLKALCQRAAIPPWERRRLPLVWHGEQLLAVADRWVADAAGGLVVRIDNFDAGIEAAAPIG